MRYPVPVEKQPSDFCGEFQQDRLTQESVGKRELILDSGYEYDLDNFNRLNEYND